MLLLKRENGTLNYQWKQSMKAKVVNVECRCLQRVIVVQAVLYYILFILYLKQIQIKGQTWPLTCQLPKTYGIENASQTQTNYL